MPRESNSDSPEIPLVEAEILELQTLDYDLSLTGFTEEEVAALFAGGGQAEPDAVPAVPETPVSRAGDLWILGGPTCPHCGTDN